MIPEILTKIVSHYSEKEKTMVLEAYSLAEKVLDGKVRGNNHPFIEHPLGVASIVSEEIGLYSDAVTAVFLHEASRFHPELSEQMSKSFPSDIVEIALSLNKISTIKPKDTSLEAEVYRKLIISYSTDPRVFLIKLADRLEIMRNLSILPKASQLRKNAETIMLYIPLAHQTGIYNIKSELEDLYLKYSEPVQYRTITNQLKATEKDRERLMYEFVMPLKEKLTKEGIEYTLKARTKSAYSIWKKMQVQNIPFEQVYDVFAVRFIIKSPLDKEKELCWKVYSLVTEEYEPDTSRLRDWLDKPKPNGYQSLHTTVKNKRGKFIEVQIRTERMDYEAEMGYAAHWSYKGVKREGGMSGWLSRVHNMMEKPEYSEYKQFSPSVLQEVFVFTPDGDLRQLRNGASVLDFAFDIHTNLGMKCTGAIIGGKMVPIKEKLKTGDIVEILSNKNQKPNADWLNYVVTSKAKSKIRQKIKEEENKLAVEGKNIFDRRMKNWKMTCSDEDFSFLVKKYKLKNVHEFYGNIGAEIIDIADVKNKLIERENQDKKEFIGEKEGRQYSNETSDYLIIDSKLKNVDYKLAKCCNPIYGDEVFGFVTIKDGIKIHRMSCPNAARLIENYPYRIQKVKWNESANTSSFQTTLKVIVEEESSSNVVITTVSTFKASIRSLTTAERTSRHDFEITIHLFVPSNLELDKIVASLKKLRGVKQVTR